MIPVPGSVFDINTNFQEEACTIFAIPVRHKSFLLINYMIFVQFIQFEVSHDDYIFCLAGPC